MTELENATPAELGNQLSRSEARQLTDQIRQTLEVAYDGLVAAWRGRADLALDYPSWDAYCAAEFSEARMLRPAPEQRREITAALRAEGMSTRAIGSALGVDHKTIVNDTRSGGENSPPEQPVTVTGTDGKQYQATRPSEPEPEAPAAPRNSDAYAGHRCQHCVIHCPSGWKDRSKQL